MPEIYSFDIGAHRILWTPDGGAETDLGFTEEGSEITVEEVQADIRVHEVGLVDAVVEDTKVTAKCKLAKATIDNIGIALNMAKTTDAGPPIVTSIDLDTRLGRLVNFGKLVLRPRELTSSDKSRDKTIYKGLVRANSVMALKANAKRVVDFTIEAAAAQDGTSGEWHKFTEGDPANEVTFEV